MMGDSLTRFSEVSGALPARQERDVTAAIIASERIRLQERLCGRRSSGK
jgi:hypothetical protein